MEISDNLLNYIKQEVNSRGHITVSIQKKGEERPIDVVTEYRQRFEKGEKVSGSRSKIDKNHFVKDKN